MIKHKPLPSIELLRSRFEIVDSDLVYKVALPNGAKRAGDLVGSITQTQPGVFYRYCRITVGTGRYESYLVHRITYAAAYGVDPKEMQVDHIDGNTLNNHPSNLRLATPAQNTSSRHKSNRESKTGIRGVHLSQSKTSPFVAHIKKGNKSFHVGSFKTKQEAASAAKNARRDSYGEFAGKDVLDTLVE